MTRRQDKSAATSAIIDRFRGEANKQRLIDTLKSQAIINGDVDVAARIAALAELHELKANETLIVENATDNDIYFILAGRVAILSSGRPIAHRTAREHVGEMALIDPTVARSNDVVATETTVIAKLSEPHFVEIADAYPHVWRSVGVQLGRRLRQRNELVAPRNQTPLLFIGSSSESVGIAHAVEVGLAHDDIRVRVWTQGGVFTASNFPIDDLERQLQQADFAALVCNKDDVVISRGKRKAAPRDNVIFELGLFMGAITRRRAFLIKPIGADIKIPTDLLGLTPLEYRTEPEDDLAQQLSPICTELRRIIKDLGPK